jgi:hypothetical protein
MQYNYAYWTEKDAKAGLYTVNSKVAYKCLDGIERVFQANEDYVGSIMPPDNDDTWDYLEDIVYDWKAGMAYKIGSVVNYNGIQYVATKRYRNGTAPPNEELDPDGIRTWMLNYEDGPEPVTPFFYIKQFGYKTVTGLDTRPFCNFLEGIDWYTIPLFGIIGMQPDGLPIYATPDDFNLNNDRFFSERNSLTYISPYDIDRRPEQKLANSVMEAHPYHDIYVTGLTKYFNQKPYFEWFPNAKHKSEIDDKFLYPYVSSKNNTNFFIPKRTIPYWNTFFGYLFDYSSIDNLTNGVSVEYYPEARREDIEIICPKYSRQIFAGGGTYYSSADGGPASVREITPLYVSNNEAVYRKNIDGTVYDNSKMTIRVRPNNICVDSLRITFYFRLMKQFCWAQPSGFGGMSQVCSEPVFTYFSQTYDYNENTRVASRNNTDTFKGKSFKLVANPAYDPNCQPDFNQIPPVECPPQLMAVEDPDYPDTSIDMMPYLAISTGNSSVTIMGWSIS